MAAVAGDTGRVAGNVADATHEMYRQYGRQIYAYCLHHLGNREEAEDAVQTTFLNAFRGLQHGTVARSEQAWLYKIAQNVCFARRASSGRRLRLEAPNDFEILQEIVPSKTSGETLELIGLDEALERMPENQRKAIVLREWKGLSYREIGEELGLSQGAVEMLIFRARRSLATALEEPAVAQRKGKRSGLNLGSLVAAIKSLFNGAMAVKIATVAMSAAFVTSSTAHSLFHGLAIDLPGGASTIQHTRHAAVRPAPALIVSTPPAVSAARLVALTIVRRPATPRPKAAEVAVTRPAAQPAAPVVPVIPAAAAPPPPATPAAAAPAPSDAAVMHISADLATSANGTGPNANANALAGSAAPPPHPAPPAAQTAPLPSSGATMPGGSNENAPTSAQQAPLPSSGATMPGDSSTSQGSTTDGSDDSTAMDPTQGSSGSDGSTTQQNTTDETTTTTTTTTTGDSGSSSSSDSSAGAAGSSDTGNDASSDGRSYGYGHGGRPGHHHGH